MAAVARGRANNSDSDSSPEVEFGTFLRPSHQHRTLSRPAFSYAYPSPSPSSPPPRPTSPPPPDLTSSAPIYLYGRPAQNVPRMRQGAPRLGGLGLGGIASGPPTSTSSEANKRKPPRPPGSPSFLSVSPTSSNGPAPVSTIKLQGTLPERPFLSPELGKPTPRARAFALDRALPDGMPRGERSRSRSRDRRTEGDAEADPERDGEEEGLDWSQDAPDRVPEVRQIEEHGHEGQAEQQEAGALFDRFQAVLGGAEEQGSPVAPELNTAPTAVHNDGSDTASSTTGESRFATPEMDATSDAEDGGDIPALTLDVPTPETTAQPDDPRLDGPVQLASSEDDEANSPTSQDEAASLVSRNEADSVVTPSIPSSDLAPPVPGPIDSSRAFSGEYNRRSVSPSTLAEALLARAEKSVSSPSSLESPSPSVLLSTTTSRTPSIYDCEPPSTDMSRASSREGPPPPRPVRLRPPSTASSRSHSIPRRSTPKCSPQHGEVVGGNPSDARDPADQYPSPPSSPATSNGPTDSVAYGAGSVSPYPSCIKPLVKGPAPPASPSVVECQPAPAPTLPAAERAAEPRHSPSFSSFLSKSPSISSNASVPSTTPSRRLSYQGLGLRLPSSISPKDKTTVSNVASSPPSSQKLSLSPTLLETGVPPPVRAEVRPSAIKIQPLVVPEEQPSRQYSTPRAAMREVGGYSATAASLISELDSPPRDAPSPSTIQSTPDPSPPTTLPTLPEELVTEPASPPPPPPTIEHLPSPAAAAVAAAPAVDLPNSALPTPSPLPPPIASAPADFPCIVAKAAPAASDESAGAGAAGVVVDVGVAVVGTLVMGGLAVGQAAWKGVASGWSVWRSGGAPFSQVEVVEEMVEVVEEMVEVQDEAVQAGLDDKEGERERERRVVKEVVREELEKDRREEAESSVLSTEWGDAEFEAPEGFLEEFKQAMAEIGEEDLAANEQAERDAQRAAYAAASRQHDEATSSEAQRTLVFPSERRTKSRPASLRSLPPRSRVVIGVEGDSDEVEAAERELMDLLSPMWDSPAGGNSRVTVVEQPARHDYAAPPGLSGSHPISRTITPTSVLRSPSTMSASSFSPSIDSFAPSSRAPPQPSRTAKHLFKLGPSSTKKDKKDSKTPPASIAGDGPSLLSSDNRRHGRSQSLASAESLTDKESKSSSRSSSHQRRRRSMFSFGSRSSEEQIPPVPSLDVSVADTAYVDYGTGKSRRRASDASIPAGLYASRDPYLLIPDATAPSTGSASAARPTSTLPRRSSLRQISRYDSPHSPSSAGSSGLDNYDKKLYRVRFGNAHGGLGLRSVAEDEAERAGGGSFPMAWVGVGRGRYGNLTLKTDEESDELYAEQVAQIKKRWRAFGSHQERDWAAVKIE